MARKKRSKPHEEEASEAWLLPYSDLLTLLLALFICLFGMSATDEKKVQKMGQAFQSAFNMGGGPAFFNGAGPFLGQYGALPMTSDNGTGAYLRENEEFQKTQKKIQDYAKQNNLEKDLNVHMTEGGLLIRISDQALFPSGSAQLLPESQRIVPMIGGMISDMPEQIIISGHTDNVPISTDRYPSNWELSTDRALNFMRLLLADNPKLDAKRFSAVGYAEFRPAATNDTEEGRQKNRRVEVLVSRMYRMPDTAQKIQ